MASLGREDFEEEVRLTGWTDLASRLGCRRVPFFITGGACGAHGHSGRDASLHLAHKV